MPPELSFCESAIPLENNDSSPYQKFMLLLMTNVFSVDDKVFHESFLSRLGSSIFVNKQGISG